MSARSDGAGNSADRPPYPLDYPYDALRGAFIWIQTISTLPRRFTGFNTTAEFRIHRAGSSSGNANRGHNSVPMLEIDDDTGMRRERTGAHVTQDIDIKALIRTVPDFPKAGVQFRDITTLLKSASGFNAVVEKLGAAYRSRPIDKIAAIESRGFILGGALAYKFKVGFVPIRKQGKLPAENFGYDYQLEYGADRLELHRDGIGRGERVLLVDDLIATGGTAEAALRLIDIAGGSVVGCAFVVDLPDLGGRARLERLGYPVLALCQFPGH